MPYTKSPRPYKHEYEMQKKRGEHEARMERQRARRAMDKTGKDADRDGTADAREGKDIDHKKMLKDGGTNARSNLRAVPKSVNRAWAKKSPGR